MLPCYCTDPKADAAAHEESLAAALSQQLEAAQAQIQQLAPRVAAADVTVQQQRRHIQQVAGELQQAEAARVAAEERAEVLQVRTVSDWMHALATTVRRCRGFLHNRMLALLPKFVPLQVWLVSMQLHGPAPYCCSACMDIEVGVYTQHFLRHGCHPAVFYYAAALDAGPECAAASRVAAAGSTVGQSTPHMQHRAPGRLPAL